MNRLPITGRTYTRISIHPVPRRSNPVIIYMGELWRAVVIVLCLALFLTGINIVCDMILGLIM